MIDGDWSYFRRDGETQELLFNLREDAGEQRNRADDPALRSTLDRMRQGAPSTDQRPADTRSFPSLIRLGDPALHLPARTRLSPLGVIALAIACGLAGGYLDVAIIIVKKFFWNERRNFQTAADFPWTVPVAHVALLALPSIVLAFVCLARPRPISLRGTAWLFSGFAMWMALLRLPLYGVSTLLLAVGLGRPISEWIASLYRRPKRAVAAFSGMVAILLVLAALSSSWLAVRDEHTRTVLPAAPPNPRNVLLIVWDTVRANHLSVYGYDRETTPYLKQWAQRGIRFDLALAPAPWTFPSHGTFFTGLWPFQLNTQWKFPLDPRYPTLAEYLASRGYTTAGFVGNTVCCSYETGLDRGFAHFEDYPLSPWSLVGRTIPGRWLLATALSYTDLYAKKWVDLESRGAVAIDDAFLAWLDRRQPGRPFFAFINHFDAHQPYIAPAGYDGRFGIRPGNSRDYEFLTTFAGSNQQKLRLRDVDMARDCYDNCIAFLDAELGRLLHELEARKLLETTDVIIMSDHGEEFAEHGVVGHNGGVMLNEVGVPLVILSPRAIPGRVVNTPVSLRDLPATVVDLLGLSEGSPFPGRSLAPYWRPDQGSVPVATSPAFTEQADEAVFKAQHRREREHPGFQMSLVALGYHYIGRSVGVEQLYHLTSDPYEQVNVLKDPDGSHHVDRFRKALLDMLTQNPGSTEVEAAYLKSYRQRLEDLVAQPDPATTISAAK